MKKIIFAVIVLSISLQAEEINIVALQKTVVSENKRVAAMSKDVEMMKHRIPQAGALDDPKLKFGLNNVPTDSFSLKNEEMTSKEIGISQMIPLWGKLGARERITSKEYLKAREKFRKEKIELLHIVRVNYYEIEYNRLTLDILNDIRKQLRIVIESEVAANKTGMGSLSNVIKANIEYNMIEEEIINLKQKNVENEQKLYYLIGKRFQLNNISNPEPAFIAWDKNVIIKTIISENPDLAISKIDIEIAKEEISLKRKEYYPDMDIGVSYMQRADNGGMKRSDMVGVMAAFNIPVWFWKKNNPMIDEMKNKYEANNFFYQDKINEMANRAEVLYAQLNKWKDLYMLYRDKLIPQTEIALEANLARYKTNTVEFMPVIDTVRMMLRNKKDLYMAKKEYLSVYSELYSLMGGEILQ